MTFCLLSEYISEGFVIFAVHVGDGKYYHLKDVGVFVFDKVLKDGGNLCGVLTKNATSVCAED